MRYFAMEGGLYRYLFENVTVGRLVYFCEQTFNHNEILTHVRIYPRYPTSPAPYLPFVRDLKDLLKEIPEPLIPALLKGI